MATLGIDLLSQDKELIVDMFLDETGPPLQAHKAVIKHGYNRAKHSPLEDTGTLMKCNKESKSSIDDVTDTCTSDDNTDNTST